MSGRFGSTIQIMFKKQSLVTGFLTVLVLDILFSNTLTQFSLKPQLLVSKSVPDEVYFQSCLLAVVANLRQYSICKVDYNNVFPSFRADSIAR